MPGTEKKLIVPQSPKQLKKDRLKALETNRGKSAETQKQILERIELKLDALLER